MSDAPLDALLEKLTSGDNAAAEQVFRAYEPYLRMVVRRHLSPELRAKFDSLDIVQSVWVQLLRGFREAGWRFADSAHLRAFLVQMTRRRFVDRLRQHRRALEREQPLELAAIEGSLQSSDPAPQDILEADELWEQLLELCPPAHRDILHLKRDGAGPAEIASRTGLHEGSIRRILRQVARRLVLRQEEGALPETDPGNRGIP